MKCEDCENYRRIKGKDWCRTEKGLHVKLSRNDMNGDCARWKERTQNGLCSEGMLSEENRKHLGM